MRAWGAAGIENLYLCPARDQLGRNGQTSYTGAYDGPEGHAGQTRWK